MTLVHVRLRNNLDKTYDTQVDVKPLDTLSRLLNAFAVMGFCWLGAAVCILIPVLHFVLVPAGLLGGVFGFFYKFAQREQWLSGAIRCLSCNEEIAVKAGAFNWPKKEMCPKCATELVVEK